VEDALGVGVSETVGVGVGVDVGAGVFVGVLEQAERPPAKTSATTANFIPRFTSKPFRSKPLLSTIPTR
jgi:hypothetical protein